MNIIEELYYGNIRPNERQIRHTAQYLKLCNIATDTERKLAAFLADLPDAENEKHLLLQMINAQAEISDYTETRRFVEGFRLGAQFVFDIFDLPNNSISDYT